MTYENLHQLLTTNTAVKLLKAEHASLILSFLHSAFKQNNNSIIREKDLSSFLSDHLFTANGQEKKFPKTPKEYLTDWTNAGFLRKYFESNDEPIFELTPAAESTLQWIADLHTPEFIGTESRLKLLFDMLKELSSKSKRDYQARLEELEKEKQEIEKEIDNVKMGRMDIWDDRQLKEHYINAEETAQRLLADFRQVEQNFRELDREFRKKIVTTSQTKGKVLEELFSQQDYLWETEQGKSFRAFWEFLFSQSRQEELEKLIDDVLQIPAVQQLNRENLNIGNIKNNLIDAGDKTNRTTGSLLEQLRKYLEHKSFFENKRIHDNIAKILKIIGENAEKDFDALNLLQREESIRIDLTIGRPLFKPPQKIIFANHNPDEGASRGDAAALYEQFDISTAELKKNIAVALRHTPQISFSDFIQQFHISKGVAEVICYIDIATKDSKHICDESENEEIVIANNRTEKHFKAIIPRIIFCR